MEKRAEGSKKKKRIKKNLQRESAQGKQSRQPRLSRIFTADGVSDGERLRYSALPRQGSKEAKVGFLLKIKCTLSLFLQPLSWWLHLVSLKLMCCA